MFLILLVLMATIDRELGLGIDAWIDRQPESLENGILAFIGGGLVFILACLPRWILRLTSTPIADLRVRKCARCEAGIAEAEEAWLFYNDIVCGACRDLLQKVEKRTLPPALADYNG